MRTLLATTAIAGGLIAGIGPAAAAPLTLTDNAAAPAATQIAGSSDMFSGSASASGSAQSAGGGIWNFLCSLGPCTYTPPVVH